MKVLLIGVGQFVRILSEKLHERGVEPSWVDVADWEHYNPVRRFRMLRDHDLVHFYWGRRIKIAEVLTCRWSGMGIIYTFIGSDVLRVESLPGWKRVRVRFALRRADRITAVTPWLREELEALHIDSDVMPFAFVGRPKQVSPLPSRFTVLSYIPMGKEAFYGWPQIERLARDMPDVDFAIVGHDGTALPQLTNVRYHGWVDAIEPLIDEATAVARLTRHDGLSRTVLEALSRCRHVFWTYDYPHCQAVKNYAALHGRISALREHPSLNKAGGRYVWERFPEERIIADCLALYENVLAGRTSRAPKAEYPQQTA